MERTTSFGYWLRRRRKARDLTQEELARRVGCAVGTIKKLESDERRPSKQLAERLADLLEVAPEERAGFLKTARAEIATDKLDVASVPLETPAPAALVNLPSGTVTFLFTDIEGSTQLWSRHPETMRAALACHDALLREAVEHHGGAVFKTVGDAFHAAFSTAADALAAALAAQRALQAERWAQFGGPGASQASVAVRVALHTGTADVRGDDYIGPTLNRVARILAAGHGGQILLSAATWELVRDQLPPEVALHDLGAHWLKGLPRPEQIYQLVAPELRADFPPLVTLDRPTTNLPTPATALIGREREVAEVSALLHENSDGRKGADARLVTLTGPGGIGKTRLALEVAASLADFAPATQPNPSEEQFPDGIWFVDLAPISAPGLVASVIAQAFGVHESRGQSFLDSLKHYLRAKRLLLVLDNFEQVVEAAPLVAELLAAAPGIKVLVTSRMPLRLSGEREFAVPPLGLPPLAATERGEPRNATAPRPSAPRMTTVGELTQFEAVRLFIERAKEVKTDFAVTNENAPAVAEICYRLDGLPLAIELAAARVKLFPPPALLARLSNRLTFLTRGARDLPARQQTIRNTIDWSHELLDAGEKTLFARLGVFVGGCTLEAAEAVCNMDARLPMEVVEGVSALLDKSLVRQVEGHDGAPRITMLETIREYALERLAQSGEAEALQRVHAEYFLGLAEEAEAESRGPKQLEWFERLEAEHANLRAALEWFQQAAHITAFLRLTGSLGELWLCRGHLEEGRRWLGKALTWSSGAVVAARAKVLLKAGLLEEDLRIRQALYDESLAIYRELEDVRGTAFALLELAQLARERGDIPTARARTMEGAALFRELGDPWDIAYALISTGLTETHQGNYSQAQQLLEESLERFREIGDSEKIYEVLNSLGMLARARGNWDQARALFEECIIFGRQFRPSFLIILPLQNAGYTAQRQGAFAQMLTCFVESLELSKEIGDRGLIATSLAGVAGALGLTGRLEQAARIFGAAEALLSSLGEAFDPLDRIDYDDALAATRPQLDEATFAAAWAAGRAMMLEQATAEALSAADTVLARDKPQTQNDAHK
jgi:predicted ATPase/class 3 adenylate cyclase